jgi:hypothetical protein
MELNRKVLVTFSIRSFFLFSFLLVSVTVSVESWGKADLSASIYIEKAFLWDRPGFTWKDCRAHEPNAPFFSANDRALTMKRASESKPACDNRQILLSAGEQVKIFTDKNDQPIEVEKEMIVGDKILKKNFFQVQIFKNGKLIKGWIPASQLTPIHQYEKPKTICEPKAKGTNTPQALLFKLKKFQQDVEDKLPLASQKSQAEVDRFMCLYNDEGWNGENFETHFKKFRTAAKNAATSFGLPYALVMCTMLVESGLKHRPNETKEYRGYGQFGSDLVFDLSQVAKRKPYSEMWNAFQAKHKNATLTDDSIRQSADPTASAAAIALALRWIYKERIPAAGCKDCTSDFNFNRKDLYLMVMGYNYGPYTIGKVVERSSSSLHSGFPPPEETRHYMTQMDRCLTKGHISNFREKSNLPNGQILGRSCK